MNRKLKHPHNRAERLQAQTKHEQKKKTKASYVRLIKEQVKDQETHDELRKPYDQDQYIPF